MDVHMDSHIDLLRVVYCVILKKNCFANFYQFQMFQKLVKRRHGLCSKLWYNCCGCWKTCLCRLDEYLLDCFRNLHLFKFYILMNIFAVVIYFVGIAALAYTTYFNHSYKLLPSVGILTFLPFVFCSFVILLLFLVKVDNLESDAPELDAYVLNCNWTVVYACYGMMFLLFLWTFWEMMVGIARKPEVFWRRGIPTDSVDLISFGWWSRLIRDGDADNLSPILEFVSVICVIITGVILHQAKWLKKRMEENAMETFEEHSLFDDEDIEDLRHEEENTQQQEPMVSNEEKSEKPNDVLKPDTNMEIKIDQKDDDNDSDSQINELKIHIRQKVPKICTIL